MTHSASEDANGLIEERVAQLRPIFDRVILGDFSKNIVVPENQENEPFAEIYIGIEAMLEVIREKIDGLEKDIAQDNAIFANIGDGLIVTDDERRITIANRAAQALLGFTSDELLGKLVTEVIKVEDEEGKPLVFKTHLTEVMKSDSLPFYYQKKDGTRFPVSFVISPILLKGKVTGSVEIFRDVTHEKELDHAKDEFINLSSHQLRTPASTIKWSIELLREDGVGLLNKEQQELLESIDLSNEKTISIIGNLLLISKMQPHYFRFDQVGNSVEELVRDTLEKTTAIEKKKLLVHTQFSRNLKKTLIRKEALEVIIKNLIGNAVDYTPDGGKITIALTQPGDNTQRFTITDTGIGIPKKEQPMVFGKFFRASNAIEQKNVGSGLGLHLVKKIIDGYKGSVSFESSSKGSIFTIEIPTV